MLQKVYSQASNEQFESASYLPLRQKGACRHSWGIKLYWDTMLYKMPSYQLKWAECNIINYYNLNMLIRAIFN